MKFNRQAKPPTQQPILKPPKPTTSNPPQNRKHPPIPEKPQKQRKQQAGLHIKTQQDTLNYIPTCTPTKNGPP